MDQQANTYAHVSRELAAFELSTTARVLDAIRTHGAIARAEIARLTGLSRSAAGLHVDRLLEHGLIREDDIADSTGGRRARRVAFNKAAGFVAAIDQGATSQDVAMTNLAGEVLAHRSFASDVAAGPDLVLNHAKEALGALVREAGVAGGALQAIGMGVPGPVEFKSGRPVAPPIMPGWNDFPIREFLGEPFGCPVYVDNDVNVMALGEQWAGLGRGVNNFLFIKVGTGIGCGIVCRGELYRGADGCAGDIGHIEIEGEATVCRCGNAGCLEAVAAAPAIVRLAQQAAAEGRSCALAAYLAEQGDLTARDVGDFATRGDHPSVEIIKTSGRLLGHVLASLVNFFNPSLIVVGGGVSNCGDTWLAAMRQEIYRRSLPLGTRNLVIQRSQLGELSGVVGAAALAIQQMFLDVGLSLGDAGVYQDGAHKPSPAGQLYRG